ncbi:MAG TPA: O-methyltransferase, partial [Lachnospiraceae bacterium]|nr:O-methyltransferase [Lachnospiraceae bacterium]
FLYEMTHSEQWDSVILPVGDGALLSYKKTNVKQM